MFVDLATVSPDQLSVFAYKLAQATWFENESHISYGDIKEFGPPIKIIISDWYTSAITQLHTHARTLHFQKQPYR